jgi:hypothetical protein
LTIDTAGVQGSIPQGHTDPSGDFRFGFFRWEDMLILLAENSKTPQSEEFVRPVSSRLAVVMRNNLICSASVRECDWTVRAHYKLDCFRGLFASSLA